ncbi:MAG: hypothetical protein V9G04_02490 [Nocardioides sp.]|jgi:hypothetical protein
MTDLSEALGAAARLQQRSATLRPGALSALTQRCADDSREVARALVAVAVALPREVLAHAPFVGVLAAESALSAGDAALALAVASRVAEVVPDSTPAHVVISGTMARACALPIPTPRAG